MMRQCEKDHKQYRCEVVDRTERPSGECCAASELMSTHNITLYYVHVCVCVCVCEPKSTSTGSGILTGH